MQLLYVVDCSIFLECKFYAVDSRTNNFVVPMAADNFRQN